MSAGQHKIDAFPFNDTLTQLSQAIADPNAGSADMMNSTDNAVSALGRLCANNPDKVDLPTTLGNWLQCLPLTADMEEARISNEHLLMFIERHTAVFLGPNNENLPKIIEVIASTKKESMTQQIHNNFVEFLTNIQQNFGDALSSLSLEIKGQIEQFMNTPFSELV